MKKFISLSLITVSLLQANWYLKSAPKDLIVDEFRGKNFDAVWVYRDGKWLSYNPNTNEGELKKVKIGEGFWVKSSDEILKFYDFIDEDNRVRNLNKHIKKGWNLLGTIKPISKGYFPKARIIWTYKNGKWRRDPNEQIDISDGFWLKAKEDFNYTLSADRHIRVFDVKNFSLLSDVVFKDYTSNEFGVISVDTMERLEDVAKKDGYDEQSIMLSKKSFSNSTFYGINSYNYTLLLNPITKDLNKKIDYKIPNLYKKLEKIPSIFIPASISSTDKDLYLKIEEINSNSSCTFFLSNLEQEKLEPLTKNKEVLGSLKIDLKDYDQNSINIYDNSFTVVTPIIRLDNDMDDSNLFFYYLDKDDNWKPLSKAIKLKNGYYSSIKPLQGLAHFALVKSDSLNSISSIIKDEDRKVIEGATIISKDAQVAMSDVFGKFSLLTTMDEVHYEVIKDGYKREVVNSNKQEIILKKLKTKDISKPTFLHPITNKKIEVSNLTLVTDGKNVAKQINFTNNTIAIDLDSNYYFKSNGLKIVSNYLFDFKLIYQNSENIPIYSNIFKVNDLYVVQLTDGLVFKIDPYTLEVKKYDELLSTRAYNGLFVIDGDIFTLSTTGNLKSSSGIDIDFGNDYIDGITSYEHNFAFSIARFKDYYILPIYNENLSVYIFKIYDNEPIPYSTIADGHSTPIATNENYLAFGTSKGYLYVLTQNEIDNFTDGVKIKIDSHKRVTTKPLLLSDRVIVCDEVGNLYAYSYEGKLIDKIKLDDGSSSLIQVDKNIIINTFLGTYYKFTKDLKLIEKVSLNDEITQNSINYNGNLFTLGKTKLFFSNKPIFEAIDDVFTTISLIDDKLLISSESGRIWKVGL